MDAQESKEARRRAQLAEERGERLKALEAGGMVRAEVRLWVKNMYQKWNPGKWKHGLKPAVQFLVG